MSRALSQDWVTHVTLVKGQRAQGCEGNMLSGWSETLLIHGNVLIFQYVHFVYVWIISQHLELVKEIKKCNFPQRFQD